MMSFKQPDEIPEIPLAGLQVGDTSLLTPNGVIHLPDCSVLAKPETKCSCGAVFAKPSEFTADDKP